MKECVWYNGTTGCYEILDFDPNKMTTQEILDRARAYLAKRYTFDNRDWEKAKETLYLLNVDGLKKVTDGKRQTSGGERYGKSVQSKRAEENIKDI